MSSAKTPPRKSTASGPAAIEQARLQDRAAAQAALHKVLLSVPKVDPGVVPAAVLALLDAVDEYNASLPLVDETGRRERSGIAEARASMRALHKSLETVERHLAALPVNARKSLAFAYDEPIGRFSIELPAFRQAAHTALDELNEQDNKPADANRRVLAYRVAQVFRDILKKKPSSASSCALNIRGKRGGAAYARVLCTTLKIVGVVQYDEVGLIREALKLLKDPLLPPPPTRANI